MCRDKAGGHAEFVGNAPPKQDANGWWIDANDETSYIEVDYDRTKYEQSTGIHLAPGEGPVELEVRKAGPVECPIHAEVIVLLKADLTALREVARALVESKGPSLLGIFWTVDPDKLAALEALIPKVEKEGDDDANNNADSRCSEGP